MTFLAKQRSLQGFYDKIERKSESYKKGVRRTLENNFEKFLIQNFTGYNLYSTKTSFTASITESMPCAFDLFSMIPFFIALR